MPLPNNDDFNTPILTDGGLETDLIFNHNIDLPHFAAFPLIEKPKYRSVLQNYYKEYLDIARQNKTGFILESPTWRANPDWGYKLGYTMNELFEINKLSIYELNRIKKEYEADLGKIFVSGCIGPRFDGYNFDIAMSVNEARIYNLVQIEAFCESGADMVTAITMTNSDEALGIVLACKEKKTSSVISFTVELDGNLPSGETLQEAISKIDEATNEYPLYYMINCAHPSHFASRLCGGGEWTARIGGIRANASCKSHAELDEATELDIGDKASLAEWHITLKNHLPNLMVYGGCCGTDVSHVKSICEKII